MSTLAERLQRALDVRSQVDPSVTQAGLARACGKRGPSVSDWFTGETKKLKGDSLIYAAEYLHVRARWLLDGTGSMALTTTTQVSEPETIYRAVSLEEALQRVLKAIADAGASRWPSIRGQLDQLHSHPEMRDDVAAELANLLTAPPIKRPSAGRT